MLHERSNGHRGSSDLVRMPRDRAIPALLATFVVALGSTACARRPAQAPPHPVIVIGVDGGEWSVVRALWKEGRLPNLRRLAERGVTADLETAYGISPVIWTTIATGREPRDHGVTDFVVSGPSGNVPVSSSVRRVPALWNLMGFVGRRVAVLGWYVTWPAEAVEGVMITDNVMRTELEDRVHPAELGPRIDALLDEIRALPDEAIHPFGVALTDRRATRDLLVERLAPEMAAEGYDLLLVYFRAIDHLSHFHWKYWQPGAFEGIDAEELAERRDWIPAGYERFDAAVGEILATAPDANVLVVSDHGFHAVPERYRIYLDVDTLLHHLGYLERNEQGVDLEATRAYSYGTARSSQTQTVQLKLAAGEIPTDTPPGGRGAALKSLRERFVGDMLSVSYEGGDPVFSVRAPDERPGIVKLDVRQHGFSPVVVANGRRLTDVISGFESINGGHVPDKAGLFIAAGPDILAGSDATGISIFDMTPTVLYALGLPVAEDFAGAARLDIFRPAFRRAHPLRTIETWGRAREGVTRESEADAEILEELRSLGYLQ